MRWVVHGQNFVNAYHAVMRNQGAAGVDGMPTEALPKHLTHHWERIKAELLRGEYCPQPVRGVKIPKPSGGTRQLGACRRSVGEARTSKYCSERGAMKEHSGATRLTTCPAPEGSGSNEVQNNICRSPRRDPSGAAHQVLLRQAPSATRTK